MRFKPGEKAVCIRKEGVWSVKVGPKYNDIVTVSFTENRYYEAVILAEYGDQYAYATKYFAPLMDISELESILQQEPATV